MTDDSQPVEEPVEDGHIARALARLTDPARAAERIQETRSRGVGALLPPVRAPEGSLAAAVDDDVAAAYEARQRVRAYVEQRVRDNQTVPGAWDILDRAYPRGAAGVDAIPLLLSDLQLLLTEET